VYGIIRFCGNRVLSEYACSRPPSASAGLRMNWIYSDLHWSNPGCKSIPLWLPVRPVRYNIQKCTDVSTTRPSSITV